jgi:molybdopterin molybdotransferase
MAETDTRHRPLPIDDALAIVAAAVTLLPVEPVTLGDAYGRFLGEDVHAAVDLPSFPSSAMDGYALRAADTPGELQIVGESAAGAPYGGSLAAGEAIAISTGAVVPGDADTVVPVEEVEVAGRRLRIAGVLERDQHVRHAGSDIRRGAPLLVAGTRLGPAQIGAVAAAGLGDLPCRALPKVAILTTGTELRPPGSTLSEGEIYDSNGPMLSAALRSTGAIVKRIPAAADTAEAHREALSLALADDVVISSGGVSVGDHDLVRRANRELGVQERFWRVAIRPGKPLSFGVREQTLVFGLPGNPVSTLVCFELFVRPALLAAQGAREFGPAFRCGRLATAVPRRPERDDFIRVLVADAAREPTLTPVRGQQSHQIAVTAGADALARIPAGIGTLSAGDTVSYLPLHD